MKKNETDNTKNEEEIVVQILNAIKGIRYGYVQITVHNSNIVQIDKTEKIRLDGQKTSKPKGGDNG